VSWKEAALKSIFWIGLDGPLFRQFPALLPPACSLKEHNTIEPVSDSLSVTAVTVVPEPCPIMGPESRPAETTLP
ncbi:hypothetical protein F2P79_017135, partial [Pimephales promelas]